MKTLHYLLLLALIVGCSKDNGDKPNNDTPIIETPQEPTPISEEIFGEWVIKSGDIPEFISSYTDEEKNKVTICSQTIEFNQTGNYSENKYVTMAAKWSTKQDVGNWKGGDNKIVISNWDGEELSDTLYIQSIDKNNLNIKFRGQSITYVKCTEDLNEFNNLEKELVGRWSLLGKEDNVWTLNSGGTGNIIREIGMGVTSGSTITWWDEHIINKDSSGKITSQFHQFVMHKDEAASGWNEEYIIEFINEKFWGFEDKSIRKK